MKSKFVTLLGGLLIFGIVCWILWVSFVGYSSSTFAGSSFHAETEEKCKKVYADFEKFMEAQGFSVNSSPSEWDSWAGVRSAESKRIWFSRPTTGGELIYLYVNLSTRSLMTHIKWEHYGLEGGADKSYRDALEFALEVDRWISEIPGYREQEEFANSSNSSWFNGEIARLNNG